MNEKIITDALIKENLRYNGRLIFKNFCVIEGNICAQEIFAEKGIVSDNFIKAEGPIKSRGIIKSRKSWIGSNDLIEGEAIECEGIISKRLVSGSYIASDWIESEEIESKYWIRSKQSIRSGKSIKSGGCIKSDGWIESGGWIQCDRWIESKEWIKSGEWIETEEWIYTPTYNITTKSLQTKLLPLGRHYWAEMPPFRRWRAEILDETNCWNYYRNLISKDEAQKICQWEGWHWIIRVQLEMFFELKERHIIIE